MIYCIAKTLFLLMKMYLQEVKNENFRLRRATQRKVCIKLSISIFYWKKISLFWMLFLDKNRPRSGRSFFWMFFLDIEKNKNVGVIFGYFPKSLKKHWFGPKMADTILGLSAPHPRSKHKKMRFT